MTWMCVSLPDNPAIRETILQEAFTKVWIAAGLPPDAIMYRTQSGHDSQYFFTPAAVGLARPILLEFDAVDCAEPDVDELIALVRNEGAAL
jgi:hypothetical protein